MTADFKGPSSTVTLGVEKAEARTHVEYGVQHRDGSYEAIAEFNPFSARPALYRAQEITWAHGGTVVERVITVGDWTEVTAERQADEGADL